jgi:hypothetical protein
MSGERTMRPVSMWTKISVSLRTLTYFTYVWNDPWRTDFNDTRYLSADRNTLTAYLIGLLLYQWPVCTSVTRVDYAKTKKHTKVMITPPDSLFLQLRRGIRLCLSYTVFDALSSGKDTYTPGKSAFRLIHF